LQESIAVAAADGYARASWQTGRYPIAQRQWNWQSIPSFPRTHAPACLSRQRRSPVRFNGRPDGR
jgi:hypothetical protein